jgi:hypothetical protein
MKRYHLTYFIIFAFVCGLCTSCFDDLSTDANRTISPVVIDTTGFGYKDSLIEVSQGATLSLSPKVTQSGVSNPDLSYEWRLALTSSGTNEEYTIISTEKDLNEIISKRPSSDPYLLWYVVTDKATGLQYSMSWALKVISSAGDGLLVADTKDGLTSDITLIRASCLSSGYTGSTVYKRKAYSGTNGSSLPGLISQLLYSRVYQNAAETFRVYALTPDSVVTLDPETYAISTSFKNLFIAAPSTSVPMVIQNGKHDLYYLDNENLYTLYIQSSAVSTKFGTYINYVKPGSTVTKNIPNKYMLAFPSDLYPAGSYYDETQGCFIGLLGFSSTITTKLVQSYSEALNAYDPTFLSNMKAVGSGPTTEGRHLHILKDKSTGACFFYTMEYFYDETNGSAVRSVSRYSTESCPNISEALAFETCENRDVVYYATSSAVYSAFISGSNVSGTTRFTPPSGEAITGIKLFREAWYMIDADNDNGAYSPMSENANQLLVATYNSSTQEGKVYVLPITNLTGALSAASDAKTFTGFGKITAMCTQGK